MLKQRINEYDIIKGFCVIVMIIHHCYDYFDPDSFVKLYFRFVTGAFVFFAGFMIKKIYFKDINYLNDYKKLSQKIFSRGIRLVSLFIILNLFIFYFIKKSIFLSLISNLSTFLNYLFTIFINGNYKIVAFEILLPIAYVFIIISLFIRIFREKNWTIIPFSIFLFIFCSLFFFFQENGYNLRFLTIGLLGYSFGFIPFEKLNSSKKYLIYLFLFYLIYFLTITYIKSNFPLYFIAVIFNILAFYYISKIIDQNNYFVKKITLLGEFSLISYIFQIFFLQIYLKIIKQNYSMALNVLITIIATVLFIQTLKYFTNRFSSIKKMYKIFF
jgi:hypothetical protein